MELGNDTVPMITVIQKRIICTQYVTCPLNTQRELFVTFLSTLSATKLLSVYEEHNQYSLSK